MTTEHPRIEFADIRIGDTIEQRAGGIVSTITVAWRSASAVRNVEGSALEDDPGNDRWHLVERTPPDLPTTATWGWTVLRSTGAREFDCWHPGPVGLFGEGSKVVVARDDVADFIAAELVPAQLVDSLRMLVTEAANTDRTADGPLSMFLQICGRFIDHVDQANGRIR